MNDKEQKIKELLTNLNNYINSKFILKRGYPFGWEYIYENGNYYVVNISNTEKHLISLIDIFNSLIDVGEPEIADIISYKLSNEN